MLLRRGVEREGLNTLFGQPLDDALLQAKVLEGEPALALGGMAFEHVLEAAKGASSLNGIGEAVSQARVLDGAACSFIPSMLAAIPTLLQVCGLSPLKELALSAGDRV